MIRAKQINEKTKESLFDGLSLSEYLIAKKRNCQNAHRQCKVGCKEICEVANMILCERYVQLSKVWRQVFPSVKYDCEKAIYVQYRPFDSNGQNTFQMVQTVQMDNICSI